MLDHSEGQEGCPPGLEPAGLAHPSSLLLLGGEARRWARTRRDRGDSDPHTALSLEEDHQELTWSK